MPDHPPHAHRRPRLSLRLRLAFARREASRGRRGLGWRLGAPVVFVVAGVLFVTSAVSSGGTDLRAERYDDLEDLAGRESQRLEGLQDEAAALNRSIDQLTQGLQGVDLQRAQARVQAESGPAGTEAARGPGLTVTLTDAPKEVLASAGDEIKKAYVHQQDIQAVVNALWAGGAEAMTLQGQRVVSTTGIKCVGNSVILHGVPYSPPYVISAIGDQTSMRASLDTSPYIAGYLEAVRTFRLGYDVQTEDRLTAPAYDGTTDLSWARVVGGTGAGTGS